MSAAAQATALTGSDQVIYAGRCVYRGFSVRETAGAAAVVRIYDNATTSSGTLLETISLAANQSAGDLYVNGIEAHAGIFVKIVSGTVEGSVRIA